MVRWSDGQIGWLSGVELPLGRGGYVPEDVETMRERILASMRAGQQFPDPTTFALARRRVGQGYVRADVDALVHRLKQWRTEAADAQRPPSAAPAEQTTDAGRGPTPLRWTHAQIDWVRDRRFRHRRSGYDATDVDDFLDAVIVAMAHGQQLPNVAAATFDTSGRRRGYDFAEVDQFLDDLQGLRPADPA